MKFEGEEGVKLRPPKEKLTLKSSALLGLTTGLIGHIYLKNLQLSVAYFFKYVWLFSWTPNVKEMIHDRATL